MSDELTRQEIEGGHAMETQRSEEAEKEEVLRALVLQKLQGGCGTPRASAAFKEYCVLLPFYRSRKFQTASVGARHRGANGIPMCAHSGASACLTSEN